MASDRNVLANRRDRSVTEMEALQDNPLFSDPDTRRSFPAPIAVALDVMVAEIEASGEVTTADETAAAIEATLCWLGRVWVAEYLHATERDPACASSEVNRELLERVASARPMTTGGWVGLGRRIRALLVGSETVVQGLSAVEFGDDCAALLHFRNHFSHGSFALTLQEIRRHRSLLHHVLASVPALRAQLPLCREPETGTVRAASAGWPVVANPEGVDLPEAHPVVLGVDGRILDLYPLLVFESGAHGMRLQVPAARMGIAGWASRAALAAWIERYTRERDGHLEYLSASKPLDLPEQAAADLRQSMSGLVLVVAYPGCGGGGAVAALTASDPLSLGLSAFDAIRRVEVRPGELGQSGVTVAHVVLRLIEDALGEPSGSRQATSAELLESRGPLQTGLADLAKAQKRALLGIENLELGVDAYREEPLSVVDVYERLAGSAVTVVATTTPGAMDRPLFDRAVTVAVETAPDAAAVSAAIERLTAERPLHRRVLSHLCSVVAADLFEVCDALDRDQEQPVFEPAVERALWDLQPLLRWQRVERVGEDERVEQVRSWSVFSPVIAEILERAGGRT